MNQTKISIPLIALMMSFVAFSIDAVLPALGIIGADLHVLNPNDNQLIITSMFIGLGIGQIIYGPISDSIGRKPTIYIGFFFFLVGSFLCLYADDIAMMSIGRVLQGFGLSANRIVCIAMIRDVFKSNEMAKVMSFIFTVFIIVPTIAPALGQFLLNMGGWKMIFIGIFLFTTVVTFWFTIKQSETLPSEHRSLFSLRNTFKAIFEIFKNKQAITYTLVSGLVFASFMTYLNLSQQIFQIQYQKTETFPYYFALIALSIGLATFLNGRIVERFGMFNIVNFSLLGSILFSGLSTLYLLFTGEPSFIIFILFLIPIMFCIGLLFGNLNSIAMEPLGHIAGVGASVIGSLSTFMAVPLATYIGSMYSNSTAPLFIGFFALSMASMMLLVGTNYFKFNFRGNQ